MGSPSFFSQYPQKDISIGSFTAKSPLFFRDMAFSSTAFLADLKAVKTVLPPWVTPIVILKNYAIIVISSLEYRNSDIGPYNEISVSVMAHQRDALIYPKLNLALSLLSKSFYAHVLQLPVTTEIAVQGGIEYFN